MDPTMLAPYNLLRYVGQVLIVVAAAELGMRLVRPTSARFRLACWRLVIAVCLLLPLVPVRSSVALADATASSAARTDIAAIAVSPLPTAFSLPAALAPRLLPWLLIGGAIARAAWLSLGFARLRQLRATSRAANSHINTRDTANKLAIDIDSLKHALAPRADLRWHDEVTQPMTFGLRRPIVILPPRLADLPPDAQRAVVCHELLHVARHDWAWMLAEEALRTACWWHPAIWWALAHIELHREQAIDADVIAFTTARRPYMHALLAFADPTHATEAGAMTTAPTVLFIRRRHLAARLAHLAQEVPVSKPQLTSTVTTLALIIAAASWTSIAALPLLTGSSQPARQPTPQTAPSAAAMPVASDDKPIRGGDSTMKPRVIHEVKPEYTQEAFAAKTQGEVEVEVRIAKNGSVADARIVKSTPLLDKPALDALRQWKFEPPIFKGKSVEVLCTILVRFTLK